jgi:hypothetical protein
MLFVQLFQWADTAPSEGGFPSNTGDLVDLHKSGWQEGMQGALLNKDQ